MAKARGLSCFPRRGAPRLPDLPVQIPQAIRKRKYLLHKDDERDRNLPIQTIGAPVMIAQLIWHLWDYRECSPEGWIVQKVNVFCGQYNCGLTQNPKTDN
jgi:hypothetical protein